MAKYVLWYFKPQYGDYAVFDTNIPLSGLRDLGFDYMIVLHATGENAKYGQMPMSGSSYDDGYNDGRRLTQWLEQEVNPELPYLIEIPVLVKDDNEQWELFKNSSYTIKPAVRGIDYWKGWIDGIYTNTGGLQRGFYWNLEFPWQAVRAVVYEEDISALSEKIKDWGQQFIWIPYAHGGINPDGTDIKSIGNYFTYVFLQPNYYQGKTSDLGEWYSEVLLHLRNVYNLDNLYMELECDGRVNSHDTGTADHYKNRACEYVDYAKDLPHKAYYYGISIENVRTMKEYCNGYI